MPQVRWPQLVQESRVALRGEVEWPEYLPRHLQTEAAC